MRPRGARPARGAAAPLAAPVGLGLLVGLAWWLLAPTAPVGQLPGGTLVAPSAPELAASQDGVLAVAGAVAGLLCAAGALVRPGRRPLARSLLVLAGCVLGSAVAWWLGTLLGPGTVAAQRAAGAGTGADPVTSPLAVHSAGVLLVWPLVAALVLAAGHLAAAWAADPAPADPEPPLAAPGPAPVAEPASPPHRDHGLPVHHQP